MSAVTARSAVIVKFGLGAAHFGDYGDAIKLGGSTFSRFRPRWGFVR